MDNPFTVVQEAREALREGDMEVGQAKEKRQQAKDRNDAERQARADAEVAADYGQVGVRPEEEQPPP